MAQDTFPQVPDVASFDLLYTSNDGVAVVNCQNRLWAHKSLGWSTADMVTVADLIRAGWAGNVAALVQTEYVLTAVRYKNWDNPLNAPGLHEFTDVPGTAAGDPIPFTSAAIVRFYTQDVEPTQCYIRHGGIVESQVDGQHLSTTAQTAIRDAWDAIIDAVEALSDVDPVCVSPYEPGGTPPNVYRDVALYKDIQPGLTICRRRLGRAASRQS